MNTLGKISLIFLLVDILILVGGLYWTQSTISFAGLAQALEASVVSANEETCGSSSKERAYLLVCKWAKHAREKIDHLLVDRDGSFRGQIGAPYFEYSAQSGVLAVRGLVDSSGHFYLRKELFSKFREAEQFEAKTLAGGHFDVDPELEKYGKKTSLNLRRDFSSDQIGEAEFIESVDNLMTAATWWRKRSIQLLGTPFSELYPQSKSAPK
jgi:hypothetical protein